MLLFVPLAPWCAGGGDREDVALSYVYAMHVSYVYARVSYVYDRVAELCVAATLAVCLVSLFVWLCVARACRHHLSSVHPYRVGVQSEPGCSSPSYLT